ncbi:MAG: nucleotide-binding protein [Flavobacteriales bacterium]|nr:nucleotide-binding protein [Flavobacteriales bacterium]
MAVDKKIKPLLAALKRTGIRGYLTSHEFSLFMLEKDWDEKWDKYKTAELQKQTVFIAGDDSHVDEALGRWMSDAYNSVFGPVNLGLIMVPLLCGYVAWEKKTYDYLPVLNILRELEVPKDGILKLAKAIRARQATLRSEPPPLQELPQGHTNPKGMGNKVFVVHGHDDKARLELVHLLKDELGLQPIVVRDQPNQSMESILGKIERLADECHAAIVLMTPDDSTSTGKRARQNVVLELGYFLGLWRKPEERRIILIRNGAVEIPSDIAGVIYMAYHEDIEELHLKLKRQFEHWQSIG